MQQSFWYQVSAGHQGGSATTAPSFGQTIVCWGEKCALQLLERKNVNKLPPLDLEKSLAKKGSGGGSISSLPCLRQIFSLKLLPWKREQCHLWPNLAKTKPIWWYMSHPHAGDHATWTDPASRSAGAFPSFGTAYPTNENNSSQTLNLCSSLKASSFRILKILLAPVVVFLLTTASGTWFFVMN